MAPMMAEVWTSPKGSSFRLDGHEQQRLVLRRPRLRLVRRTLLGLGQPLRVTGPVRELPEDRLIAVPVRLKCHTLTIA